MTSEQLIGVEFEFEFPSSDEPLFVQSPDFRNKLSKINFEVTHDDSLRNGVEFRFVRGLPPNTALKSIDDLYYLLSTENIKVVLSERTSTHVHINILGMTHSELQDVLKTYLCFEKTLFKHVSEKRLKSNYCVPLLGRRTNFELYGDKYDAFNMNTIHTLGTVEFRHFQGSPFQMDVLKWVNICNSLVNYIKLGLSFHDVISLENPFEIFNGLIQPTEVNIKDFKYSLARVLMIKGK